MVALEGRRVPTVLVATEVFQDVAQLQAEVLGQPHPRMIVVPHPIGGRSEEYTRELGKRVAQQILQEFE